MKMKRSFVIKVITAVLAIIIFEVVLFTSYNSVFTNNGTASASAGIFQQVDDVPFPYTGTLDEPVKPGYNCLETEKLKNIYEALEKSVYNILSAEDSDGKYETLSVFAGREDCSQKELYQAATAFFDDNPQVFWCDKSVLCNFSEENGAFISSFSLYSVDEINAMSRQLSQEVLQIVNGAPTVSDHYYVEKYVHDSLIDICSYTVSSMDNKLPSTAYGCLVQNSANCEGITDGFNLLMKCLGYETFKIYGSAQGIGLHTWSCIKLGNEWYMTDVTWDLRDSGHSYDYFNISTREISKTHNIEKTYDKAEDYNVSLELANKFFNICVPECNDLNQSYFARESYSVTKESDVSKNKYLLEYIYKACMSGFDYCSLKISSDLVEVDKIVETMFSEENVEYYNNNMNYRLYSGDDFRLDVDNYEVMDTLDVLILRFTY